jgi:hypothetical protein
LQNQSQINGCNLINARCATSRTFRNKKREYLKEKVIGLETNSNIRDVYRGINKFKDIYQPRTKCKG